MGKSHQTGSIVLRGKRWYWYYRKEVIDPITEDVRVARVVVALGLKSQMTKPAAREALRREIAKQTGQIPRGQNPEGRDVHLRMVRSQPLPSDKTGRLAARNGEGEDSSN